MNGVQTCGCPFASTDTEGHTLYGSGRLLDLVVRLKTLEERHLRSAASGEPRDVVASIVAWLF